MPRKQPERTIGTAIAAAAEPAKPVRARKKPIEVDSLEELEGFEDRSKPGAGPARAEFPRERFLAFVDQCQILSKEEGRVPFVMNGAQRYVLDEICEAFRQGQRTIICLKARQLGMSTLFLVLDMFWCFEHDCLQAAFVIHENSAKNQFRGVIKTLQAWLPDDYKQNIVIENRDEILFANRSKINYLVAGVKDGGTSNLGRGNALNYAHMSETAFWGNPEAIKELQTTFSTRYPHQLFIWESTANGYNHFQEMWESAEEDPTRRRIFAGWYLNESYRFERDTQEYKAYLPGGDKERVTPLEMSRIKAVKKLYDIDIEPEQLAWYRWKLVAHNGGDQSKMDENYPWTPDDAFVATGSKYFSNTDVSEALRRARVLPCQRFRYEFGPTWLDTVVHESEATRTHLRVWEEPAPGGVYAIGCDPAFGSSDESDRSCISIWRGFSDRIIQVAEYCLPTIEAHQVAWVIAHLAGLYVDSFVNLEISGPGAHVAQQLARLKMEMAQSPPTQELRGVLRGMRQYIYRRVDSVTGGGGGAYHTRTTRDTKWRAMSHLKSNFETKVAVVNSKYLVEEMKNMVIKDGNICAGGSGHDDRVMAAALAITAWVENQRMTLIRNGMTMEAGYNPKASVPVNKFGNMVDNYLKSARIQVPKR